VAAISQRKQGTNGQVRKINTHLGENSMKISARNMLRGKVKKIIEGAVNSEVILELAGGTEVVSVITKESVQNLKLAVGKDVYAVVKASSVMIATD
jgi:molybdopterin-binding protein